MPIVARRVARPDGIVDAAAIGRAARLVVPGPALPEGDPPGCELQLLKYLWHTVVAHGHDAAPQHREPHGETGGSRTTHPVKRDGVGAGGRETGD